jgi:uncharacterized membrane protein
MDKKNIFPLPFAHDHPPVENVNALLEARQTLSIRLADRFAAVVGSWLFIIVQTGILIAWVVLNVVGWLYHWDPYPFILMNLLLSLQAAYSAPIIMMSQNRMAERDRLDAHNDYLINVKSEEEVRLILEHLEAQNRILEKIHDLVLLNKAAEVPR